MTGRSRLHWQMKRPSVERSKTLGLISSTIMEGKGSAFGSKRSKSRNKRWRGAQYARGARYLELSACPVKATEAVRLFYPSRERRDIDPEGAYCPLNVTWHWKLDRAKNRSRAKRGRQDGRCWRNRSRGSIVCVIDDPRADYDTFVYAAVSDKVSLLVTAQCPPCSGGYVVGAVHSQTIAGFWRSPRVQRWNYLTDRGWHRPSVFLQLWCGAKAARAVFSRKRPYPQAPRACLRHYDYRWRDSGRDRQEWESGGGEVRYVAGCSWATGGRAGCARCSVCRFRADVPAGHLVCGRRGGQQRARGSRHRHHERRPRASLSEQSHAQRPALGHARDR